MNEPVPTEEIIAAVYGPVPPPYLAGLWPDAPDPVPGYTAYDGRWWPSPAPDPGPRVGSEELVSAGRPAG